MGDRSQVAIKQGNSEQSRVYLYAHWGGADIYGDVQRALGKAPDRHGDPEYLARIIFQEMLGDADGATGFGISTGMHDDIEHPLIVLDCDARMITFEAMPWHKDRTLPAPISFAEYIKLPDVAAYAEPSEEEAA